MKNEKLLFRVDASTKIGMGHVMRCLALAQAWQTTGRRTIFVMATEVPAVESRCRSENIDIEHLSVILGSVEDAKETIHLAHQIEASWVVLDGYHFDSNYQKLLKNAELQLLCIDDCGYAEHYYADLVLNQNIGADETLYPSREAYTKLLLGTRYALLRREFWQWRDWHREIPPVARKILVTLGGSDPDNVTLKVIQALQQVEENGLEAIVVIGGSNPHYEQLEMAVQTSTFPISLKQNAINMPELMAWADVAIAAGGSTNWELAFMGLPSIIILLADNQRNTVNQLSNMGIVLNLGWHENVSSQKIYEALLKLIKTAQVREQLTRVGKDLVDGRGSHRILKSLENSVIILRSAKQEDCRLLWEWVNEPSVRASSFIVKPISWETHVNWFTEKLQDSNCYIFIALDHQNTPIGQVRFDKTDGKQAIISIHIAVEKRGFGYGVITLRQALKKVFFKTSIQMVNAFIKMENKASINTFDRAGFKNIGIKIVKGYSAFHYVKQRDY